MVMVVVVVWYDFAKRTQGDRRVFHVIQVPSPENTENCGVLSFQHIFARAPSPTVTSKHEIPKQTREVHERRTSPSATFARFMW